MRLFSRRPQTAERAARIATACYQRHYRPGHSIQVHRVEPVKDWPANAYAHVVDLRSQYEQPTTVIVADGVVVSMKATVSP